MVKILKKFIFIFLAVITFIYLVVCNIVMTFSFIMNAVFITAIVLFILIYYLINNPLNLKERAPSFIRIFINVFAFFYFLGIGSLIIFNIFYPKHYLNTNNQTYDYIIVFGAGISENKTAIMNSRINKAVEYSKIYPNCKFVLTGAKGGNEMIEEAIYMRNYLKDKGIDDKRLLIEPNSVNTNENILNSLNLIKKDIVRRNAKENIITRPFKNTEGYFDLDFLNIGFMSSEFHLTRINMMAKKIGISRPYDIPCRTEVLYIPYLYIREDLSIFKALILNQIKV